MSMTSDDTPKKQNKNRKGDRADPLRFVEPGINYKGKLIGIEDVPEPRGDKICQVAMAKLKAAVKTLGDHKQKIIVNVSLQGVRIIDEKSELLLHFHPVHRISFISRDPNDSRAFGYVFGNSSGSHQFYGIKTEKVAEGIVVCLRDLFQVVFEMKKQGCEWNKNCLPVEEPFSEQKPSPKMGTSRTAWLKSDYWSRSVGLPPSELYRGSLTPGSVKKEMHTPSKTCQSPVTAISSSTTLKQSGFASQMYRSSMTPEPIYQNACVLPGRVMQSAVTSATPSPQLSATARVAGSSEGLPERSGRLQKTRLSDGDKEWVSFEFDDPGKLFDAQPTNGKNVGKKDPFANDPFFARTVGSEATEESVVWTRHKGPATSEPVYGVFVEPERGTEFTDCVVASESRVDGVDTVKNCKENLDLHDNSSTLDPYPCSSKPTTLHSGKCLKYEQSLETPSDQDSSSDLVSFPSPDAPPPPLLQTAVVLLHETAPLLPPRPGVTSLKQNATTVHNQPVRPNHSSEEDSLFKSAVPGLNQCYFDNEASSATGCLPIPDPPPRQNWKSECFALESAAPQPGTHESIYTSLTHKAGAHNTPLISQDPFALAISKKSANFDGAVLSRHGPIETSRSLTAVEAKSVDVVSPSATVDWVNAQHEQRCMVFSSNQYQNIEVQDPFLHKDPFGVKIYPADLNCDLFEKKFPADSQSFQARDVAGSGAFDRVFSNRDELYETIVANHRSPVNAAVDGNRQVAIRDEALCSADNFSTSSSSSCRLRDTSAICATGPETSDVHRAAVVGKESESFIREPKLEQQSSFDSVLNDFAQRFPPIDDGWMTFSPEDPSPFSQSERNIQVSTAPSEGSKSRLSVPKSSDSSSNSEIAEAFCEESGFFFNCKTKQQEGI